MSYGSARLGMHGGGGHRGLAFDGSNSLSMSNNDWGSYDRSLWAFACTFRLTGDTGGDQLFISRAGEFEIKTNYIDASSFRISVSGQTAGAGGFTYNSGFVGSFGEVLSLLVHFDRGAGNADDQLRIWINGVEDTPEYHTNPGAPIATTANMAQLGAMQGQLWRPAFFSGALPSAGALFRNGLLKPSLSHVPGLHSYLDGTSPTHDTARAPAVWSNIGNVILYP